jgi:hypothetical protein
LPPEERLKAFAIDSLRFLPGVSPSDEPLHLPPPPAPISRADVCHG